MSVYKNLYLGAYIKLPKCDWYKLAEKLKIDIDEFNQVPKMAGVFISNYMAVGLYNEDMDEPKIFQFSEELKEKAEKRFMKKHAKTLEKLKVHFKKDIAINFGFISYCY